MVAVVEDVVVVSISSLVVGGTARVDVIPDDGPAEDTVDSPVGSCVPDPSPPVVVPGPIHEHGVPPIGCPPAWRYRSPAPAWAPEPVRDAREAPRVPRLQSAAPPGIERSCDTCRTRCRSSERR